jgi:hypothetical protein
MIYDSLTYPELGQFQLYSPRVSEYGFELIEGLVCSIKPAKNLIESTLKLAQVQQGVLQLGLQNNTK